MTLTNNRAPLLCYFKLCASFRIQWWIQTGVTVRKHPIWVKIDGFFSRVTLKFDGSPWKNNMAPLLSNIKPYASFHHHVWIQKGVTVRKRLSCVITSVTLTFDLWPWPLSMAITSVIGNNSWKFRDDGQTDKTDRQTDKRTNRQIDGQE